MGSVERSPADPDYVAELHGYLSGDIEPELSGLDGSEPLEVVQAYSDEEPQTFDHLRRERELDA